MFGKLFAETGLSLDRLRALVEVGASGSIVRAAAGDPVRQSQYSRQIKELEDFFQATLVERHGKGVRLTAGGRELARISRFFLLGLSNFQRGCLAEGQSYRIGAPATFSECFLLPLLARWGAGAAPLRFAVETVSQDEVERRLHELTLDFGIVGRAELSRPLQTRELGRWRLGLWVPKALCKTPQAAAAARKENRLPLVCPAGEIDLAALPGFDKADPALSCGSFTQALALLQCRRVAALLPDFLAPAEVGAFHCLPVSPGPAGDFKFLLAWNPRLLRLNPHAARRRDALAADLKAAVAAEIHQPRRAILCNLRPRNPQ